MLQRIQSIYLLLGALAIGGLFALPFAQTDAAVANSSVFQDAIFNIFDIIGVLVLFCLGAFSSLVAIFLYNNRTLQMKVGLLSIVLILAATIWAGFTLLTEQSENQLSMGFGIGLPLVSIIFILLANNSIKKDDKLVKSMDRLR